MLHLFRTCLFVTCVAVTFAEPPIWSQQGCGISKYPDAAEMPLPPPQASRVVGGEDTRPFELPWQASIRRKATDRLFCGGAIINERWILIAAHCLDGETPDVLSVVVGDWDRSDLFSPVRNYLEVESLHLNSAYNPNTMTHDIALIKVTTDIPFSEDVFPVCAPDPLDLYVHRKGEVSGWGTLTSGGPCCPNILQYATLNVTSNDECNAAYGVPSNPVLEDMVCAGDNVGNIERDTCQGDSGGPLTVKDADGTFRVVGLSSWGIGCASGYPGVYSRVGYYVDWIEAIISTK